MAAGRSIVAENLADRLARLRRNRHDLKIRGGLAFASRPRLGNVALQFLSLAGLPSVLVDDLTDFLRGLRGWCAVRLAS